MGTQPTLPAQLKRLARRGWVGLGHRLGSIPSVLVVGTGRSGTGYVSRVLRECGLRAGHETVYTPAGPRKAWRLDVEVSWLAYPYAEHHRGRIFQVVRDPIAVVRSFYELRWFARDHWSPHKQFAARFFQFTGDEVLDAMRWYCQLNEHFERHAELRFRVEDPADGIERIVAAARPERLGEVASALARVHKTVNAKASTKQRGGRGSVRELAVRTLADLPPGPELERLRAMAARYGYPT